MRAAPATGRVFLGGLAAVAPTATLALPAVSNDVQGLWAKWVAISREANYGTSKSDDDIDFVSDQLAEIKEQIASGPPSIDAIAAIALMEIETHLIFISSSIADAVPGNGTGAWAHLLRHLRPQVGGLLGQTIGDLLDNPTGSVTKIIHRVS